MGVAPKVLPQGERLKFKGQFCKGTNGRSRRCGCEMKLGQILAREGGPRSEMQATHGQGRAGVVSPRVRLDSAGSDRAGAMGRGLDFRLVFCLPDVLALVFAAMQSRHMHKNHLQRRYRPT